MKKLMGILAIGVAVLFVMQGTAQASSLTARNTSRISQLFFSPGAFGSFEQGSPVGPHRFLTICHKGHLTMVIPSSAWPSHRNHGDYLGPCHR
jgi:hypothetical protein